MKIAVLHSLYKPYTRGGAEVVVNTIVSGLVAHGEDVFVVSVGYDTCVEEIDGVEVYRIKPWNIFNFLDIAHQHVWKRYIWHVLDMVNVVQAIRIYRVLRAQAPDLVLVHSLKGLGYLTPLVIRLLNIRQIHTVHDMQLLSPTGLLPADSFTLLERVYQWICKIFFLPVRTVIVPSEFVRQVFEKYSFFVYAQVHVISNPLGHIEDVLIPRDSVDDVVRMVYVGQVEEYKGILTLLHALQHVDGNWQLQIVGDGGDIETARMLAKTMPNVTFLGRLSSAELRKTVWPTADILVHPSQTAESFGMNVVEAFSFGVPVVASRIGALPELVQEGRTGWLCEPKNEGSLQSILAFVVTHPEVLGAMRMACTEESKRYGVDQYIKSLFSL